MAGVARDEVLAGALRRGDGDAVRARVPRKKLALDSGHEQLIDSLVDARLVSSDQGDLQIAHEALAREWPRLRSWLEEDVEGQRIFRHLASTADTWETMGRPDSELYRGVRLAGAADWADHSQVELTGVVSQAGVLDLWSAWTDDLGGGAVEAFLGHPPGPGDAPVDPLHQVPLDVPVHCVHATGDDTVPIAQSHSYVRAATAAGATAELTEVEGDHFTVIEPDSEAWAATLQILETL